LGLSLVALCCACGGAEPQAVSTGAAGAAGAAGGGGEGAATAGDGCAPGTIDWGSGCQSAGVPPEACAAGFEATDEGGCRPLLPPSPCGEGELALPGDTSCHPVMPCLHGRYAGIETDGDTQHVDAGYRVGDSDGSADRPWPTIQQAVAEASAGATVAVAAGDYHGIVIVDRPLTLWGRCPAFAKLHADGEQPFAIVVVQGADGTVIRGLSITGDGMVGTSGSKDVLFDRLWLHDLASVGLTASEHFGESQLTVRDTLLERVSYQAVGLLGGETLLERVVIRDTQPLAEGLGRGVDLNPGMLSSGSVVVRASLLDGNRDAGVFVANGSDVTIEGSVVRGTAVQPLSPYPSGFGVFAQDDGSSNDRSRVVIRASVIEANHTTGVAVSGADLDMESTVVRGTLPHADDSLGRGVQVQHFPLNTVPASATIRSSLIEDNFNGGVIAAGASLEMVGTRVRRTAAELSTERFGIGLGIEVDHQLDPPLRSNGSVTGCAIEHSHLLGVSVVGADVVMSDTFVSESRAQPADGLFGDGIVALGGPVATTLQLSRSQVASSDRAGLANFAAAVVVEDSEFSCNAFDLNGERIDDFGFSFEDRGGSTCGCGAAGLVCKVLSAGLEPPATLP
jgi:hypothetical protein